MKELAAQRGAFAATLKVASRYRIAVVMRYNHPVKVSKMVKGEVKEVEVGVVNTHLATWYSDTEEMWSQVRVRPSCQIVDAMNLNTFKVI